MYPAASKPVMFNLPSSSRIGSTVLFRRTSSHDVSFDDSCDALRIFGLAEGQSPPFGAYPLGAFGSARTSNGRFAAGWAFRALARGMTVDAESESVPCYGTQLREIDAYHDLT